MFEQNRWTSWMAMDCELTYPTNECVYGINIVVLTQFCLEGISMAIP